jgi:ribosomal protein S18 acetylase RimI-like enzyme
MIRLRKYRTSDQEQVYELVDRVIREIFHFGVCNAHDLLDVKRHYTNKGGVFYVVLDGNKVVGTIGVFLNANGYAKIKRMYIDKDYRKKGIGQKLMDKIIKFCKFKHYSKITLTTYPQMKAARAFYIKNGFKKTRIAKDSGIVMMLKLDGKRLI